MAPPPRLPQRTSPLFKPEELTVIFVLGGPGSGKGTQCELMVKHYGFEHLSAGDLLRAEQDREGSDLGDLIRGHIKEGTIVPAEVTVQLLENEMQKKFSQGKTVFLIDGFPRKLDQAHAFENNVAHSSFTMFFECSEDILEQRLLSRGLTSGRADDNLESIKKRFNTFVETTMPVVDLIEARNRLVRIEASKPKKEVFESVEAVLAQRGIRRISSQSQAPEISK